MTFIRSIFPQRRGLETGAPLTAATLAEFFAGSQTTSGVDVNTNSALGVGAVSSAVKHIASTIASVAVREVDADGEHSVNELRDKPNEWTDAFRFRELEATHILLFGNAYHYIERRGGRPIALHSLDPSCVTPTVVVAADGKIVERVYVYQSGQGAPMAIPMMSILHISGFGWDGVAGKSVVRQHADSIGVVLAAETYAGKLFGGGNLMAGLLVTDKRLTQDAAASLKARWRDKVQGLDSAHDVAILDHGVEFKPLSMPPRESQFIEARQYGVEEIARIFQIPISFLSATSTGATSSTVSESELIYFTKFNLDVLARRIDAAYERVLLPTGGGRMFTHVTAPLVKADTRTRAAASVLWRKAQVKSINEIRADEGLAPLADADAADPLSAAGADGDGGQDPGTNLGNSENLDPADEVSSDSEVTA